MMDVNYIAITAKKQNEINFFQIMGKVEQRLFSSMLYKRASCTNTESLSQQAS